MSRPAAFAHPFERQLAAPAEWIEGLLEMPEPIAWTDFWLNPRRLRGSDFLMRWSQGVWSEQRLVEAVHATADHHALAYGPSGVAPTDDVRAFELYFERLEAAGLGNLKRPDLLVFRKTDLPKVKTLLAEIGGAAELPFTPEEDPRMVALLRLARLAVECENSLWRAAKMPDFATPLRPQRRLGGRPGLRKGAVLPTIIIKEEDRAPLREWQRLRGVPLHVWHVFFDRAYGLGFDRAEWLIENGHTEPTEQTFQAGNGATQTKRIYKHFYFHGYALGRSVADPALFPAYVEDKNGHILPYVRFEGGNLELSEDARRVLAGQIPETSARVLEEPPQWF